LWHSGDVVQSASISVGKVEGCPRLAPRQVNGGVDKDLKQICKRCAIPCGAELAQLQARQRLFAEEIGISFAILCERDNLSGNDRKLSTS